MFLSQCPTPPQCCQNAQQLQESRFAGFPPGLQQGDNISQSPEMVEMRLPCRRGQHSLHVPWWEIETSTMGKAGRWTTAPALADLHPQDRASATKPLHLTEVPVSCPVWRYIFSLNTKASHDTEQHSQPFSQDATKGTDCNLQMAWFIEQMTFIQANTPLEY